MKRRLKLKNERYQRSSSKEVREGKTYFPETDFEDNTDTTVIPPPHQVPEETAEIESVKGPMVVFDLETTGLGRDSHITQIAAIAMDSTDSFSCYVLPKCMIPKQAVKINGISEKGKKMFHNGSPVEYHTLRDALSLFLKFL